MALDPTATEAADAALWKAHPELDGRELTMNAADAPLRSEWLADYNSALSGKGSASNASKPVASPTTQCPLLQAVSSAAEVGDKLHILDFVEDAAQEGIRQSATENAFADGLTSLTAKKIGAAAVKDSDALEGLGILGAGLSFISAAEATGEVLGSENYDDKVKAASKAFGAMTTGVAGIVAGATASAYLAPVVAAATVAGLAAAGITAPAWVPAAAAGAAAVAVAATVAFVANKLWNKFADDKVQGLLR